MTYCIFFFKSKMETELEFKCKQVPHSECWVDPDLFYFMFVVPSDTWRYEHTFIDDLPTLRGPRTRDKQKFQWLGSSSIRIPDSILKRSTSSITKSRGIIVLNRNHLNKDTLLLMCNLIQSLDAPTHNPNECGTLCHARNLCFLCKRNKYQEWHMHWFRCEMCNAAICAECEPWMTPVSINLLLCLKCARKGRENQDLRAIYSGHILGILLLRELAQWVVEYL